MVSYSAETLLLLLLRCFLTSCYYLFQPDVIWMREILLA